ncbi:type II toxin-antitoxin system RelE/ParE family toxin [Rhizobium rosettiformans]|uniref:type II toxin-antitoxin system RelE/ParE family toxin n=1 Tax=Rhizobium rosettiformans TaxID=1368430 RepID=UPI00285FBA1A|nr:type II toxin-antitoxin system RelE/ParE family toxin [Rhizobium rosettiformans]MDR7028951.1 toxin ParE1/3/4 [Rhizobium rosettiformans]MDR7063767.1 toxin ParE1/3/4 [Rhizobium rosettiformans]
MAPDSARYTLAPEALRDLENIWAYGAETWSPDQADCYLDELVQAFDRVARSPTLFRERLEFTPPVRIYPYRSHLIVYLGPGGQVTILRILGGRQDWQAVLRALD